MEMIKSKIPLPDAIYDCIVVIDCHEHLDDPLTFTEEISRITKPGGMVLVSVPNGDERMLVTKIKRFIGMTKEKYGHVVTGFDIPFFEGMLHRGNLRPISSRYH